MRVAQTKSNDTELLFVFKWSKPKNRFSNSVSAVVYVEDLCPDIKGWNDEIAIGSSSGKMSCSFGARTSQSGAKRLPNSRASGDLD